MQGTRADDYANSNKSIWQALVYLCGVVVMLSAFELRADTIDTTGQEPYEQCGYCHEYDGNTRMANFPRLAGQWPDYLRKQLEDFRAHRRISAQMNPTAELLSAEDINSVVNYFSEQTPRALNLPIQAASDRQLAEQLFSQGDIERGLPACSTCHGEHAQGQLHTGTPAIAGQQPDYVRTQLKAFRSGSRNNDPQGQMRRVAALLSDREILVLKDYLARMKPQKALAKQAASIAEPAMNELTGKQGQAIQSLH